MSEERKEEKTQRSGGSSFLILLLILVAFAGGYYLSRSIDTTGGKAPQEPASGPEHRSGWEAHPEEESAVNSISWTCAMHPQIKLAKPGKCPICGMDLIPLEETASGKEREHAVLAMSESARRLAEIETTTVKRERANVKLRMVGMIFEDETRVAALTSRVDGRLDKIFVDFTGVRVDKGDPMVTIWSPTLIRSQVELFETIRSTEFDETVVKGAVEKLKQLGLTDGQIEEIRKKKKPSLYITLRAPISGIVMKKNVLLGDFVKEGTVMYEISDLSKVWVKLDAYETDLPWIRFGQKVTFTTPAIPGRKFRGTIVFIDPVLSMRSRTVKVRVEAENSDLALKPHMFVSATIDVEVDRKGRVIKSEWAGKYICPIYPDQVYSEPGICPKSGMPLRPASAFGYAADKDPVEPLVIPATAVLYTGKRSLVYVEVPHRNRPTYEMRQVVLGPRAGDNYVVYEGLLEGERVVTNGSFKIDSAAQILAEPSMMNPVEPRPPETYVRLLEETGTREPFSVPDHFGKALIPLFHEYANLKDALVQAHSQVAANHAERLLEVLHEVEVQALAKEARDFWYRVSGRMFIDLKKIAKSNDIKSQRSSFRKVSETLATAVIGFREVVEPKVYIYRCPTAFHQAGAYWIEKSTDFSNPYLGKKMLKCGNLVTAIPPDEEMFKLHAPARTRDPAGHGDHKPAAGSRSKLRPPSNENDPHATHQTPSKQDASHGQQQPAVKESGSQSKHGALPKHEEPHATAATSAAEGPGTKESHQDSHRAMPKDSHGESDVPGAKKPHEPKGGSGSKHTSSPNPGSDSK